MSITVSLERDPDPRIQSLFWTQQGFTIARDCLKLKDSLTEKVEFNRTSQDKRRSREEAETKLYIHRHTLFYFFRARRNGEEFN